MLELLSSIPVSPFWQKLIGVGIIVVGTIIVAFLVRIVLYGIVRKLTIKTKTELDDQLIAGTRFQVILILYLFGGTILFNYLESILTETMGEKIFRVIDGILYSIGVLLVASLLVKALSTIVHWYGTTIAARTDTNIDDELLPLLDRSIKVVIYLLSILIIMDHFQIDVKGLITVLGVGSLAVALASQDTIANMIGGFVIMIDRPFRAGDWLRLPSGQTCHVHQIGVRSTKFLTLENTLIIVPNAELMKSTIHNITYPHPETQVKIEVGVGYGSDMERVKAVMLDEAAKHPSVVKDPTPFFRFLEFGESSLKVSMFCMVPEVTDQWRVGSELRTNILERFRRENIEIPFPQQVVTIVRDDDSDNRRES